ncbi:MAG TPA: DUF4332 domain-containing protein [Leptolyngbyaceae cyanobacterium]
MRSQSWNLEELPGLDPDFQQKLAQCGIQTTGQLLQRSRTVSQRQSLARQLHLPLRYINKWFALADLARIPSVGCQYNGLLLHAGIISVAQLTQVPLGTLHVRLRRLHVTTLQRSDLCPDPGQIAVWLKEARQLPTL